MPSTQNQNSSTPAYRAHELIDSHDLGAGIRFFDAHDPAVSLDVANHNRGNMEITINGGSSGRFNLSVCDRQAAVRMIAGAGQSADSLESSLLVQLQALAAELSAEVSTDYASEWERGEIVGTRAAGERLAKILEKTKDDLS